MTIKDRTDRLVSNAVGVRNFILENLSYDHIGGHVYMRGTRNRVPVEPGEDGIGKKPRFRIMGQAVLASHVAYILKTGGWPKNTIRHMNGDESDIRWSNMQLVRAESDEEVEEIIAQMASDKFLADLRKYHPNGPPTYKVKSSSLPITFNRRVIAPTGYGNNPLADR